MNLSQLEVLVAIVDSGSLSEAGEVVGLTQSAVSYSLSKLEAELGVTLLERGRQGISLTRSGAEILPQARSVLAQVETIRQIAAQMRGLSVGKLRFGCVPTIPSRLLTGILRDFQHRYPDVEVVLFEGTPNEISDWLQAGVIDIGTVGNPEGYAVAALLAQTEVRLIVASNHPLASQTQVQFEELANEALIGPRADYVILSSLPALKGLNLPRLRHEVGAYSTILAMVRERMGVALIPAMLMDPDEREMVGLPFEPRLALKIYLSASKRSPANEAFLHAASRWAREHGFQAGD